jgi:serine/threonine protein kinase
MLICSQCQTLNDTGAQRCAGCGAVLDDDAALSSDPFIGRLVADRFLLHALLGSGDLGLVYRATDAQSGAEVAVKLIHPDVSATIGERLLRSAAAISQVRHPKLGAVISASREPDGTLFIASEFIPGQTLKVLLERNGPLGPRRAADILFQLCSALAPIHRLGRPHANLKPENVFLSETNGQADFVQICDVGVPDLFGARKGPAGQVVIGSPKFFSPEQAQGQAATVHSDQFTLGIIAYQLLTGALPFFGATPDQLLAAISAGTPVPVSRRVPGVQLPPKLEETINRCLSKAPQARYADLRALATDVAAVIKGTQSEAAPPRKKAFVQASTVMADPASLGAFMPSAESIDDDEDGQTRVGGLGDGQPTPSPDSLYAHAITPAVSAGQFKTSPITRPSPAVPVYATPPVASTPPRPPTQNDMASVPAPLMATGALDSADLAGALEAALESVGASGSKPQIQVPSPSHPHAPAFADDLEAALAAAEAEVSGTPASAPPRRVPEPDAFGRGALQGLGESAAGAAAALQSAQGTRPSSPPAPRYTQEIMSAIDEELVDASVSVPASHLSSALADAATALPPPPPRITSEGQPAFRPPVVAARRRRTATLAIVAVVAAIAVGVLLFWLTTGSSSDAEDAQPSSAATRMPQSAAAVTAPVSVSSEAAAPASVQASTAPKASPDDDLPAAVKAQIRMQEEERRKAEAARQAGQVARLPVPVTVYLVSDPPGATVLKGDTVIGMSPMEEILDSAAGVAYTFRRAGFDDIKLGADPTRPDADNALRLTARFGQAAQPASAASPAPATAAPTAAPAPKKPSAAPVAPKPKPTPKPKPKPAEIEEDPFE